MEGRFGFTETCSTEAFRKGMSELEAEDNESVFHESESFHSLLSLPQRLVVDA